MPKLLTVRKQKWASTFKPNVIKGAPLNPNAASEIRYYERLARHIQTMTADVEKQLKKLFSTELAEEYFAQDANIASQARIITNALSKKYNDLFASLSKPIAEQVANEADKTSSAALHSSIKQLSGGLSLKTTVLNGELNTILTATIAENVSLIKSISAKYLSGVEGAVMRSITTGNGMQDLVPYLAKSKEITLRRARFIAQDQTRKVFNGLAEGRAQAFGMEDGEWLHTGGSNHPRKTHIAFTGQIFKLGKGLYDSTVKRYVKPGQEPGCRCRFRLVLKFEGK